MTKPLSPAAEAIFFAADGMQPRQYRGRALAAAIRTLADQVAPSDAIEPRNNIPMAMECQRIRSEILAIATELED